MEFALQSPLNAELVSQALFDATVNSKHLSTFASLTKAKAICANALAISMRMNLTREGKRACELNNRPWIPAYISRWIYLSRI
jgi:hypothetical protein